MIEFTVFFRYLNGRRLYRYRTVEHSGGVQWVEDHLSESWHFLCAALVMLLNYLRTAWRRLWKNKGFFALNFTGLYISVTASLLIGLLIVYESSFDKGGKSDLQLYRIVNEFHDDHGLNHNAVTPYPLAAGLRAAMPGVAYISQIHYEKESSVTVGQEVFKEQSVVFADSVYDRLFPLRLRAGSLDRAFAEPGFAVLTESAARRYFGGVSAIGKRLKLGGILDLQVAAVVADAASNIHLPYHVLVGYPSLNKEFIGGFPLDLWTLSANGYSYIGLQRKDMVGQVERTLADLVKKNISDKDHAKHAHFVLQPVRSIHYDTDYASSNPGYTINGTYLKLLAAIGLFLVLAACINYTNLSTAMALKKSKEVGVRKTLGATRLQLMRQLFSETFVLTGVVIVAAGMTVGFFLPMLNHFLDKQIPTAWFGWTGLALLTGLWLLVSVLSGIYPALILSGFKPVLALKSVVTAPKGSVVVLRRGLVVFQFITAQILIICAIVVSKQMDYIHNKPLGFSKDEVVDIDLPNSKPEGISALRSRLAGVAGISAVSFSVGAPVTGSHVSTGFNRREDFSRGQLTVDVKMTDRNYLDLYGLQLMAGRWFDATDEQRVATEVPDSLRKYAFVLNETAVKSLGYHSPDEAIGKMVTFGFNNITAPVIGIVGDYHTGSMRTAVQPVLMAPFPFFYYNVGIRLAGGYSPATMDAIEKAFKEVYPQQLYSPTFLNEAVNQLYTEERRTQVLFEVFTGLSIAINVLGLIGLLSFMIEQKTKEVGIRKVLGATVGDISYLLSKDFLKLIGLAFLVAAPVAGFLMHRWLQDFAYRTSLSWVVFVLALVCTVFVTAVAVSWQTLRAAVGSPVGSLRG